MNYVKFIKFSDEEHTLICQKNNIVNIELLNESLEIVVDYIKKEDVETIIFAYEDEELYNRNIQSILIDMSFINGKEIKESDNHEPNKEE